MAVLDLGQTRQKRRSAWRERRLNVADIHKYSSTQFNLPEDLASHVKRAAKRIPDFALHGDGREDEPHCTVCWGIESPSPDLVRNVIGSHPAFKIRIGKTSHFPDSGDGDVVKAEVESPSLHELHRKIARATGAVKTHSEYRPHVTLAYVKPGLGKAFSGDQGLADKEAIVDQIVFSSKNGSRETIPLLGASGLHRRYKRK